MRYNALADGQNGFVLILEHVAGDGKLAFEEFFHLLSDYIRDRHELGFERILSRFGEVQDKLWEAFRNNPDEQ